jgi:predicted house-cleaning NTP pyrophosphatase (Maf/HAM1 superfamily)
LPDEPESIAHDSVKRLLERQPHHTEALYNEAKRMIRADEGVLVIDDSTLDKPYSHQIELVTRHWSGKHHRVVQGINLISTIWTDGSAIVPVDFRIYNPDKDERRKMIISEICSGPRMNESFSQVASSSIHGIRVSTT